MSGADLQLLNLLMVPAAGLLWKISGQLSTLAAKIEHLEGRIQTLERQRA